MAQAVSVPVGQRLGGQLVMTLAATIFLFFLHRLLFLQRESLDQKTCLTKVDGSTQNLGVVIFPDHVGHFGAPQRPFWGPLVAILVFTGDAAQCCRGGASAPCATRMALFSKSIPLLLHKLISCNSQLKKKSLMLVTHQQQLKDKLGLKYLLSFFITNCGIRKNRKWNYGHVSVHPFICVSC